MTRIDQCPQTRARYRPRTHVDVATQHLPAIDQFYRARRAVDAALADASLPREARADCLRQRDVMRREQHAIIAQRDYQLRLSGGALSYSLDR